MNEEEKKAIETFKKGYGLTKAETEIILNLIEKQQKELEPIKKLNIPVETLVSEFNRLEDLEDNTEMLKSKLEKKNAVIDKMATECSIQTGRWQSLENQEIIEYFTNLVEKEDK